jgi:hypothetical protein
MASFAHLHVHSHYSMMRGVDTLETLALAARDRGMDRFALTDTNALYGFVFYRHICDEAGLKAIAGAEIVEPAGTTRRAGAADNGSAANPGRAVLLADGCGQVCVGGAHLQLKCLAARGEAAFEHVDALALFSIEVEISVYGFMQIGRMDSRTEHRFPDPDAAQSGEKGDQDCHHDASQLRAHRSSPSRVDGASAVRDENRVSSGEVRALVAPPAMTPIASNKAAAALRQPQMATGDAMR